PTSFSKPWKTRVFPVRWSGITSTRPMATFPVSSRRCGSTGTTWRGPKRYSGKAWTTPAGPTKRTNRKPDFRHRGGIRSVRLGRWLLDHFLEALQRLGLDDVTGRLALDGHHLARLEGIRHGARLGGRLVDPLDLQQARQGENARSLLAEVG